MSGRYGIDLATFSLQSLRDTLAHSDLLPSHRALRDDLNAHFATLAGHGITNVQQIVDSLKTKREIERYASETGIPVDYLTLLRRHVRGYIPNPVKFAEIPDLDAEIVQRLATNGIKDTHHFFERARTHADRIALIQQTGIPPAVMQELLQLTDLARMGWVGPIGVRLFHAAGATTVKALTKLDVDDFHNRVLAVNQQRQYMKVKLTRKDIALCIEMAKKLPDAIDYE